MIRWFIAIPLPLLLTLTTAHALGIASRCEDETQTEKTPDLPRLTEDKSFQNMVAQAYRHYVAFRHREVDLNQRMAKAKVDLDLFWSVAFRWRGPCQTESKIIIPWIVNYTRELKPEEFKISYNLCEFVRGRFGVDGKPADLLIDPRLGCTTLADPEGYTLAELQNRYVDLKRTVDDLEEVFNGALWAGVGIAAYRMNPVQLTTTLGIRVASGVLIRTVLAASTVGLGYYFIDEKNVGSIPLRELVDVSAAAKEAADGRFVINDRGQPVVSVTMPIEQFARVFDEYLGSVRGALANGAVDVSRK